MKGYEEVTGKGLPNKGKEAILSGRWMSVNKEKEVCVFQ